MILIPSLALLRAWGHQRAFAPYGIEIFPAREVPVNWAVQAGNLLHGELAWVLCGLVVGHVAMVALHSWLWRDGTLSRMAGPRETGRKG